MKTINTKTRKIIAKAAKDNLWKDLEEILARINSGDESGALSLVKSTVERVDRVLTELSR